MKVEIIKNKEPKIYITNEVVNKIKIVTNICDEEVAMLGFAKKEGLNYTIYGMELFNQEVNSTTAEITVDGISNFSMDLMQKENGVELWNDMKVWHHSHVNMPTSPSQQDDKQLEIFETCGHDFFIRMITNKKGDVRLDLYDYETGIIYKEMDYDISYGADTDIIESLYKKIAEIEDMICSRIDPSEELINSIKSEIDDKVTKKIYNVNKNNINTSQSWWDDYVDCSGYMDYSKKNEKEKEEKIESKAFEIFDSLNEEDIFECMFYINSGMSIIDYLRINLTQDEEIDLELLIEDYCKDNQDEYFNYLGYIQ